MGGKNKGFKDTAISILWVLVAIGIVLAAFQLMGTNSVDSAMGKAKSKAVHYVKCIPSGECGLIAILKGIETPEDIVAKEPNLPSPDEKPKTPHEDLGLDKDVELITRDIRGYRGPSKGEPYVNNAGLVNKETANELLKGIKVTTDKEIKKENIKYSRAEWKHWSTTEGRGCWSTRNEVLYRDAKPESVVFLDKQMVETSTYDTACAIGRMTIVDGKRKINTENSGIWLDPYSGKKITTASDLDIDHIIPLSYAAKHGGNNWSAKEKEKFANDLDNLLATSAKENRSKGDKGPGKYMPTNKSYHCQYAKMFTTIIHKYKLSILETDYKVLNKTLNSCQY